MTTPRAAHRTAVGILLAIAAIPLLIAVSKLVGARDLMGSSTAQSGQVASHDQVSPLGKSGSAKWYTTIALDDGKTVIVESETFYAQSRDGDRVAVTIRGGGDHVTAVRLSDGTTTRIGDTTTTALLGAAAFGILGLVIAVAAVTLGRRARRTAART